MHPITVSALVEEHRRDLYMQAERGRLVRAARSVPRPPLTACQRGGPRRRPFHPVYNFHAWVASAYRSRRRSLPAA